jgi:crotonobetaine/carnitine-CoA ligase
MASTARTANALKEMTFREFWEDRVEATPDASFVLYGDDQWTYAEFDAWTNELANGLRAEGVGAGTHVAMLLPSTVDMLRLQLALQKLGAVWVPLIPAATYAEATYVLEHAQAELLFTDTAGWTTLRQGGGAPAGVRPFLVGGEAEGATSASVLESGDASAPPPNGIGLYDAMAIMYTSGSTGRPKGVIQPSVGFRTISHAVAERMDTDATDCWMCVLPLFHSAATHLIVGPAIAAGASVFLRARFSVSAFWDDARRHGTTASVMMPAMLSMLLSAPPREDDGDNPLRVLFSHVRNEPFVKRFGVDVCTGWSLTETMGMGALSPARFGSHQPRMVGPSLPADTEVKVADLDGSPLPPGERGELCVRHPHVMVGYYRDPENTAKTLQDGWLHTGDLGSLDENGYVSFHGRIKNMIKRAGENIAGEELEFTIMGHEAVEECVVRGVEDPIRTEEVYATISIREQHSLTEAELVEWCRERISEWKIPRYIALTQEPLPKLANGKTDRMTVNTGADPASAWDREAQLPRRT